MNQSDLLSSHFRIDLAHQKALKKLGIETVRDLLYHLPARYEDISDIQAVSGLRSGIDAVVYGQLSGLKARKAWKSRRPIAEGWLEDGTDRVKVMWFNQPYLAKMIREGAPIKLAGHIGGSKKGLYLVNPETEQVETLPIDRHDSLVSEQLDRSVALARSSHCASSTTIRWPTPS
jgi:RecG-like helicase